MKSQWKKLGMAGMTGALALSAQLTSAKELTVGYVAAGMQYPFNVAAARGFEAAAKEAGV